MRKLFLIAAAALMAVPAFADKATSQATVQINAVVSNFVSITPAEATAVDFGTVNPGATLPTRVRTFTVKANVPATVTSDTAALGTDGWLPVTLAGDTKLLDPAAGSLTSGHVTITTGGVVVPLSQGPADISKLVTLTIAED